MPPALPTQYPSAKRTIPPQTQLPVAQGGTGASSADAARANLQTKAGEGQYNVPSTAFATVPAPNTVEFDILIEEPLVLEAIVVYMRTVNTVGTFQMTAVNQGTTNTVLAATPFDMNTLVADTVTAMTLTGTAADLAFPANSTLRFAFTSNNVGFDGNGIWFRPVFRES